MRKLVETLAQNAAGAILNPTSLRLGLLACYLMFGGCRYLDVQSPVIPVRSSTTAGHKYAGEPIAFLSLPDVTRSEVLSTLGPPLIESLESRVMLYSWERTRTILPFQIVAYERDPLSRAKTTTPVGPGGALATSVQQWGLFIGYDENGLIRIHEVLRMNATDPETACRQWRNKPPVVEKSKTK